MLENALKVLWGKGQKKMRKEKFSCRIFFAANFF